MVIKLKKYLFVLGLFASFTILNSCGLWTNFTVYYNRFYLAERAFEDAEEEVELNPKATLFTFKEDKLPANANKNFDEVIKYSSKILQFNNDTKYVNKAIYMIAKSYYYKEMYNKAARNFYELDKLQDEELGLSTKLWIAKSEMQMRNFGIALKLLAEVKQTAIAMEEEDILFQAYITEISYLIYREEYSKAINKIEELTQTDLDDDVKSEITFELGMLYITLENYEKAVEAFKFVEEGSPSFEIEFKSKLEYAKAIKHLDRNEEALQLLSELKDNSKYETHWDIIDLEIAQIELESGNTDIALEIFYSIDTGYTKNESSGIAAFMQGDIMEHIYMDYDSAKILYEKVATKKAPVEYKKEAVAKSALLKTRQDYSDAIYTATRGYQYLIDTTLFKRDSIAYAGYLTRRDSAMQAEKDNDESQDKAVTTSKRNTRTTRGTAIAMKSQFQYIEDSLFTYEPKLPLISVDSIRNQISKNKYELGNLYFSDLVVPDSAYFYYQDVISNYPNTKYFAKSLYALGSYYLTQDKKEKADSLFQFVYDNHRSDPIAKVAAIRLGFDTSELNSDPALEKYQVAELLLDGEKYYDAIEQLNAVYKEFPESEYSPKALYSIGWIYENKLADFDGAVIYYDTLKVKYPKTEYVIDISPKLGFYHSERKAVQDSIARVEKAIQDSISRNDKVIQDSIASFNKVNKDSLGSFEKSQMDSVNADSTVQIKIDSLAKPNSIIDSASIINSDLKSDSTSSEVKDSTKNILNELVEPKEEKKTSDSVPDSTNDVNILDKIEEIEKKGKK
ncbi:MAG: tetratricopeptide repeat protein [Bacteroidetes bacterium]|nr:tetratricopeptide repeat protein [Bacteroidota bacterium]MBU1799472.1 tetratricopeptide repeat protein [Bacteroidota bacterium]